MGYTHYISRAADFGAAEWADITAAARTIIRACEGRGVRVAGPHGYGAPRVTDAEIALNGSVDDAWESFDLTRETASWSFCKTNRAPYDLAVTAILLYAARRSPSAITIDSDGEIDGADWTPARELLTELGLADPRPTRRPVNVAALDARAAALLVTWDGDGMFSVRSGSDATTWYEVVATTDDPDTWTCTCHWAEHGGVMCSHVRAVIRWGGHGDALPAAA